MPTQSLNDITFPMKSATANTTYVLDAGYNYITAFSTLVDLSSTAGLVFELNGHLQANTSIVSYGDGNTGSYAFDLLIGKTGWLETDGLTIDVAGNASRIENRGFVHAGQGSDAVMLSGNATWFENSGTITSDADTVNVIGDDLTIRNSGTIFGERAIVTSGALGSQSTIINSGDIYATNAAISGGDGNDTVLNSGRIHGDVVLGDGDDTYVDKGGTVFRVDGLDGNDTYVLRSAGTVVHEYSGLGYDTVKASISWTLGANFEEGRLIGSKNVDVTGNGVGNVLTGNKANNGIVGGLGFDYINGGRGNDGLTGGTGSGGDTEDLFIFRPHSGKDVITDFQDGTDHINLGGYTGLDAFADLKGHVSQSGADLVIKLLGGDRITILDMAKGDLSDADFLF